MLQKLYLSADGFILLCKKIQNCNSKQGGNRIGGAEMRVKITLRCNECKQRNYNTMKNKKNTPERLELNKYCPFCRKHTVHTETK